MVLTFKNISPKKIATLACTLGARPAWSCGVV